MSGIQCRQIKVKKDDKAELERGVVVAFKEMLNRTGGKGFPIIVDWTWALDWSVMDAVQRVVGAFGATLLYTGDGSQPARLPKPRYGLLSSQLEQLEQLTRSEQKEATETEVKEATEAEVEEWVRRWKGGQEKRVLITDDNITRGWEAQEVMAIGNLRTENLVMRTCGFCILIKIE